MFTQNRGLRPITATMLLCVMLAGCNSDGNDSSSPVTSVPNTPQPPTPTPTPPPPTPPPPPQPPVTAASVTIAPDAVNLTALGQSEQLTATARSALGEPVDGLTYRWSSSNPAVLEVSQTGLVTARANGTATITVRTTDAFGRDVADDAEGCVLQVAVSLSISPETWPTAEVWVGARRQFTAHATDANGNEIAAPDVTWSVTDNSAATVDVTGLATTLRAGNGAQVTATMGSLSDSVAWTVDYEGSSGPGYMYTVWFPRTDDAPALLVDGALQLPETYNNVAAVAALTPPWTHDTIEKFQYEGNRIGLLTDVANGVGTFRVLDRAREWSLLAIGSAQDFQLEGNRIGVLLEGGRLRVKDGTQGAWTTLASSGATSFQLEGNRIAVKLEDGRLRAKDGIAGAWATLDATDATAYQLAGNRIGVLQPSGAFRVKDGLNAAFTTLASSGARQFRLAGNRIALVTETGQLRVKDGINGPWTTLTSAPMRQFELEGNRIGILFETGEFRVKDGINGAWTTLATQGVQSFQFQGNRIGILTSEGVLRVKSGINGPWLSTTAYGPGVTQYRLIVDNPVPPHRTTPTSYNAGQTRCRDMSGDPDCYHVTGFALPAPYYGVYCGLGRPTGDFWTAMGSHPPIDGLDAMCVHHDMKAYWYPHTDSEREWTCIVRYGLEFGRLTRDGAVIAHGDSSWDAWDAAWAGAGMRNLWDGLNNYWTATDVCSDSMLAEFDAATDASH